jgi:protein O-mannosyl-transferase
MTAAWRRWLPTATVALLALLATITTLGHDFTYDDRGVVFENERIHSLAHLPRLIAETYWPPKYGGDGYRPVVMVMFTMEWAAAHGAPWVFHLVNIVLAVATALAVFWCASAILPRFGAWVAAALFAVHPVHVEVTGNVVGQSELVVALCLSLAV